MNPKIGNVVSYRVSTGIRLVEVDEVDDDIKNGRPGFAGVVIAGADKGRDVWGYNEQILSIRNKR